MISWITEYMDKVPEWKEALSFEEEEDGEGED